MTIIAICIFFFNDTATTEIYTLSLHDALPICMRRHHAGEVGGAARARDDGFQAALGRALRPLGDEIGRAVRRHRLRFVGHAEFLEHLGGGLHGVPVGGRPYHDADHVSFLPVSLVSASRYFSDVLAMTSAGSRGAGGALFQSSVSR